MSDFLFVLWYVGIIGLIIFGVAEIINGNKSIENYIVVIGLIALLINPKLFDDHDNFGIPPE